MRPTDGVLDRGDEPPIGAHLMTPRRTYTHHGIYVGEGRVVQYGGLSRGLRRGPVGEVSLLQFARGREIWVRPEETRHFNRKNVIHRARLRLGEDRYHPLGVPHSASRGPCSRVFKCPQGGADVRRRSMLECVTDPTIIRDPVS